MVEKSHPLSENVYCPIHELFLPLKTMVGSHEVLFRNVSEIPQTIEEPLSHFGRICNNLHTEVMTLFRDPSAKINLQSADIASGQIRLLAKGWGNDVKTLFELVSQIKGANVHLDDETLNIILNEVLSRGLEKFSRIVSCLETTRAEHLNLDNGFFEVLQIKKDNIYYS